MKRAAGLLAAALLAAALVTAGAIAARKRGGADWRILQLYAGESTVDLLRRPDRVEAFRTDAKPVDVKTGDVHVGPFLASTAPIDVPADVAAELSKMLSDADTFNWRRGPKREPIRPKVGLWFVRGANVLEIAIDFGTSQAGVFAAEQSLGVQSFDEARPRLLELVKRAFPGDADVQALK